MGPTDRPAAFIDPNGWVMGLIIDFASVSSSSAFILKELLQNTTVALRLLVPHLSSHIWLLTDIMHLIVVGEGEWAVKEDVLGQLVDALLGLGDVE